MKKVSILFVANSFGDDTTYFMPYIAKDFNIDLTISNLYIGGCEVIRHIDNMQNDKNAYEYRHFINNKWENRSQVSIKEALLERKWDYVVLQEASHWSGKKDSYKLVPTLIEEIKKVIDYKPTFLWNMTWAYSKNSKHPCFESNYHSSQDFMYQGIINNVNEIIKIPNIKFVIPAGKAIQEARNIFDETLLHLPDGFHMSQPLGRYIAALTAIKTIFNVNISNCEFIPENLKIEDKKKCLNLVSKITF